jgi:hypothetical protein
MLIDFVQNVSDQQKELKRYTEEKNAANCKTVCFPPSS